MNFFSDIEWWKTASLVDLETVINNGNDPLAQLKTANLVSTPLHYASSYGSREAVKYLLDLGADPNGLASYAVRPVHAAVGLGRVDILKILHHYGADLSLSNSASIQQTSTLEYAYLWSGTTCLWDLIDLAPDAFTSDQYYNVLYWMKREKLKKSADYQKLSFIYKQQKAKEKAH
jgi:hypothetical protein